MMSVHTPYETAYHKPAPIATSMMTDGPLDVFTVPPNAAMPPIAAETKVILLRV